MKILFPFVGDSVGGSHISALELYSLLVGANIEVLIVIHKDNGPLSQYLCNKNIPFFVLKTSRLAGENSKKISITISVIANLFQFIRFIKKHKIYIVHGNDLRINLSWSVPAILVKKRFVWHQRTILSNSKLWSLIRYLCDYFIAISDVVMQSAPKNIRSNQKKTVYNPFNSNPLINKKLERKHIVNKYNLPQDCILLGYVGRIVDYKNVDFLIKNIPRIYSNLNKHVYLIIIGNGTEEYVNELKIYAQSLGVDSRIVFTGFLNNTDKIISSLDLLVAPSLIDAFGRTIVEAMLQKTPVLAAKSGGHIDIIDDGVNGIFYKPLIKDDFFNKVLFILNDKNISVLSDNAYQFAQVNFSPEEHLTRVLSIYDYFLGNE